MASELPNQKRKRGRPFAAATASSRGTSIAPKRATDAATQRASAAAVETGDGDDFGDAADPRPRKRGRPPRRSVEEPVAVISQPQESHVVAATDADAGVPPLRRKRPGRPRKSHVDGNEDSSSAMIEQTSAQTKQAPTNPERPPNASSSRRQAGNEQASGQTVQRVSGRRQASRALETDEPIVQAREQPGQAQSQAYQNNKGKRRAAQDGPAANRTRLEGREEVPVTSAAARKPGRSRLRERSPNVLTGSNSREKHSEQQGKSTTAPGRRASIATTKNGPSSKKRPSAALAQGPSPHGPGRARKSDASTVSASSTAATSSQLGQKRGPRLSIETEPQSKRRRRSGGDRSGRTERLDTTGEEEQEQAEEDGETPSTAQAVPTYRHLTTSVIDVSVSTISAKWAKLDEPSMVAIAVMVANAAESVRQRMQNRSRTRARPRGRQQPEDHADRALQAFAKRINKRLQKGTPFPPPTNQTAGGGNINGGGGVNGVGVRRGAKGDSATDDGAWPKKSRQHSHEDDFVFERVVDAARALEAELDPLQHSVALLKRERDAEQRALQRDMAQLGELEKNARDEARAWRERGRRDHVLVPEIRERKRGSAGAGGRETGGRGEGGQEEDRLGLRPGPDQGRAEKQALAGGLFKDLQEDDDLAALSHQLGGHMASIRNNLQHIDGVLPAMAKGRAALQEVLRGHLDPQSYDHVVLG